MLEINILLVVHLLMINMGRDVVECQTTVGLSCVDDDEQSKNIIQVLKSLKNELVT